MSVRFSHGSPSVNALFPARPRAPARLPIPPSLRRLHSLLVPRSSVQAAPRPSGSQLGEVPAHHRLRAEPEPAVPAVVPEGPAAHVLPREELLGAGECVHRLAIARDLADDLGGSPQLDAAQLEEVRASLVDDHAEPPVAADVGPALAADQRVEPQRCAVPYEPQGADVRVPARSYGRD